jgi:hypothetical protein
MGYIVSIEILRCGNSLATIGLRGFISSSSSEIPYLSRNSPKDCTGFSFGTCLHAWLGKWTVRHWVGLGKPWARP